MSGKNKNKRRNAPGQGKTPPMDAMDISMLSGTIGKWQGIDANEFEFRIDRGKDHNGLGTFSHEALDEVFKNVFAFVNTRITKHWARTGQAPSNMSIKVKVELD